MSVFEKDGIVPFCQSLQELGFGILSTGNTAKHLAQHGLSVTTVESYTGFEEILDGRVKTLHPHIHGGLLARRDNAEHLAQLSKFGIEMIDLVVVNLYPFEQTIARPGVTDEQAIEMIDIGGPSMLRAAAKNHEFCLPVVDPADYPRIIKAYRENGPQMALRRELAAKVFQETARYDAIVADYLTNSTFAADAVAQAGDVERDWPGTSPSRASRSNLCVRGEPTPGGALLYGAERDTGDHRPGQATAREGTLLQQHPRRRCGIEHPARVRRFSVPGGRRCRST